MNKSEKSSSEINKNSHEIEIIRSLSRELFDSINIGLVIYEAIDKGSDFIIKEFNKAAEKIEKIKKDVLIGKV